MLWNLVFYLHEEFLVFQELWIFQYQTVRDCAFRQSWLVRSDVCFRVLLPDMCPGLAFPVEVSVGFFLSTIAVRAVSGVPQSCVV